MTVNPADTVTLNIGGSIYVTRRATLYRFPNTRLYMIAAEKNDTSRETFFFDRDPEVFRFVLDYYRTGELHLPSNICGPFVRKELIFWGISEMDIQACCLSNYMRYDEEKRTKNTLFKDCFEDIEPMQSLVQVSRGLKRWRFKMWLFLDYPTSSLPAKAWAMMLLLLMITSVMCYCLQTHDNFRQFGAPYRNVSINTSFYCSEMEINRNPKIRRDCLTEPHISLVFVDVVLNSIFTVEFILKLIVAPDKKKFLRYFVSVLDIIILSSYWIYIFLYYQYINSNKGDPFIPLWLLNTLAMSQAMRILRIFKISKISRGLRVLMLTINKSIPELVLLGFLLMNGMFLFSSMIFMAEYRVPETFPNIIQAFWWSIVTLTTVGYGDSYPRSAWGYIVGSACAISGCILTGLAIPIIGNNFNTYYKYMQNQMKENKYLKQMGKERGMSLATSNNPNGTKPLRKGLPRRTHGEESSLKHGHGKSNHSEVRKLSNFDDLQLNGRQQQQQQQLNSNICKKPFHEV